MCVYVILLGRIAEVKARLNLDCDTIYDIINVEGRQDDSVFIPRHLFFLSLADRLQTTTARVCVCVSVHLCARLVF